MNKKNSCRTHPHVVKTSVLVTTMLIRIVKYQIFLEHDINWQQPGHHPEGVVEGDTPICYCLDGAPDCGHNESQSVRNDALSDFCPETWELSPKNMESMFNEFYFDKTVDALSLAAFQASAEQLDVISVPLNNGSATESKADLDPLISMWFE